MNEKIIIINDGDFEELLTNLESFDKYVMSTALQVFINKVKAAEHTTWSELVARCQPQAE